MTYLSFGGQSSFSSFYFHFSSFTILLFFAILVLVKKLTFPHFQSLNLLDGIESC
jgi:hypothetical protein